MKSKIIELDTSYPIWEEFFLVHPLVIIGSKDKSGATNLAPKHMALPMGWSNFFGFVCAPSHSTYNNIQREKKFTITFPNPDQVLLTSMTATQRLADDTKPALKALPMINLKDQTYLEGGYLFLACEHFKTVDGFGENSLITGKIIHAFVRESSMRQNDVDDNDIINKTPILAYLHPERFSVIKSSNHFPFPEKFSK